MLPPGVGGGPVPRQVWDEPVAPSPQAEARALALIEEIVEPTLIMDLDPRRSKIVRAKRPVSRISITNPEVLEVTQFGPFEFELIGLATGQTSLTFWFGEDPAASEMLRYLVRVSPNEAVEDRRKIEYGDLERKVNEFFPNSMVQLIPVADKLIIRGQASDAETASAIMSLVRGRVAQAAGAEAHAAGFAEGPAAEPYPGTTGLPQSSLVNLLEVSGEMQVLLKVRVAELSRSALREMGSELNLNFGDFTLASPLGLLSAVSAVLDTTEMELTIEALSTNSHAKILAEPNLVTLSGHPAHFIAGGEFAVPTVVGVEGAAAVTTNFKRFGTQVEFTPTVLGKDRIRLHVAPSLSSINNKNAVQGIPGLDTRAVATTVDLREGQWLAIAGLIQDQQTGSKARVPFLGDIPYLDMIFSKKEVTRDETELLILVSPELVHPLEAEEVPLILPGMEVTEPTDGQFFLEGRYQGRPDCDHRSTVWPVLRQQMLDARCEAKRQAKYQQCETYYIQGEYGFSR